MKRTLMWMMSAVVAVVFLGPLLWMVGASLREEASILAAGG